MRVGFERILKEGVVKLMSEGDMCCGEKMVLDMKVGVLMEIEGYVELGGIGYDMREWVFEVVEEIVRDGLEGILGEVFFRGRERVGENSGVWEGKRGVRVFRVIVVNGEDLWVELEGVEGLVEVYLELVVEGRWLGEEYGGEEGIGWGW